MSKFDVPDMSCGHCKAAIEKAVLARDTQAKLEFDLEARLIDITSQLSDTELAAILSSEGYPATIST